MVFTPLHLRFTSSLREAAKINLLLMAVLLEGGKGLAIKKKITCWDFFLLFVEKVWTAVKLEVRSYNGKRLFLKLTFLKSIG